MNHPIAAWEKFVTENMKAAASHVVRTALKKALVLILMYKKAQLRQAAAKPAMSAVTATTATPAVILMKTLLRLEEQMTLTDKPVLPALPNVRRYPVKPAVIAQNHALTAAAEQEPVVPPVLNLIRNRIRPVVQVLVPLTGIIPPNQAEKPVLPQPSAETGVIMIARTQHQPNLQHRQHQAVQIPSRPKDIIHLNLADRPVLPQLFAEILAIRIVRLIITTVTPAQAVIRKVHAVPDIHRPEQHQKPVLPAVIKAVLATNARKNRL